MRVGLILRSPGHGIAEFDEGFFHLEEHGYMYLVMLIVPIQVNAEVSIFFPIMAYLVVIFEDSHEMLRMFLAHIFYAKIVNS